MLVQWKDGSETWVPLKDMKELHPVEVVDYARAKKVDEEVEFAYWVPTLFANKTPSLKQVRQEPRFLTNMA